MVEEGWTVETMRLKRQFDQVDNALSRGFAALAQDRVHVEGQKIRIELGRVNVEKCLISRVDALHRESIT